MMNSKILYRNKRTFTLHAVSLLTLRLSFFTFYMIFLSPDEFFAEFSSTASGIAWMIFFLIAGNSMLFCMFWLSGRYVLEIHKYDVQGEIMVKTWSISGSYRRKNYPHSILENRKFHFGHANFSHVPQVNAPWWQLKTPSGKSLIVDLNGDFSHDFNAGRPKR